MQLKFLCLNVWLGGHLMDEVLALIRATKPDVVALQEVYDGKVPSWDRNYRCMDVLRNELRYPYDHFAPAFLEVADVGKVPQGNAVLSRFPIVKSDVIFFDVPFGDRVRVRENFPVTPRNVQHVRLDAGGVEANVFNTQGIWGEDGRDNERRIAMGRTLAERVRGERNVILAGDFNVNPDTETVRQIERHLRHIFAGELRSTFNMKRKTDPVFATAVVDMVFVGPGVQVVDHACLQDDVSDHLPLLATLTLSSP
ncbi:hypothetical protein EPO33_02595 [Patescibacteria group bacterium]|nr:MAG: hypothetical protein EPO33_02595 [Patescibacteria group bacterium]